MKYPYNPTQSIFNCEYAEWRLKEVQKEDYLINIAAEEMQTHLPFDIDRLGLYASKNLLVKLKLKIYSPVVWIPNKFSSFLRNSEYPLLISNSVRDLFCQQLLHLWDCIEILIVEICLLHSRWKITKTFTFKLYVLGKKKSSEWEALRIYWYS